MNGTASEHCRIVEFLDGSLCLAHCFVQNICVFEAFLRVLGKLKGDDFADHAERFEELIFLD